MASLQESDGGTNLDRTLLQKQVALNLLLLFFPPGSELQTSDTERAADKLVADFADEKSTRALWDNGLFQGLAQSEITIRSLLEAAQHQLANTPGQQLHWQRTIPILNGALALEQKRELAATLPKVNIANN